MEATLSVFRDEIGGPVAWREAGDHDAPIAVFFHGLGGQRGNWDAQLTALQGVRRCCAWDLPGYGDSPGLPGSLPEIAAVAGAWIEGLGGGPVDVVGLSFGGMVAQHLAINRPDLVRTLALLDTSPAFGLDGVTTPEAWLENRVRAIRFPESSTVGVEQVVDGLVGSAASDEVRATLIASMRAVPAATLEAACRALVDHNTLERLPQIKAPTLVMVGEEDTETPLSYAESIASRVPGADLVEVSGAGHLLNLEQPEVVNERLRQHWDATEENA
jgi:3-oxoadipate enol-lactonase